MLASKGLGTVLRLWLVIATVLPVLAVAAECSDGCMVDSRDGHFRLTLTPVPGDVPLRVHHDWFVDVHTADGQPVELDGLTVSGGMPGHGHGLPSQPRAEQYLGNGRYRVSGFLFNMHGEWNLRFQLVKGSIQDIAETTLALDF